MTNGRFLSAAARLFTVQGSWNYDRLLGIGVGFATEPLLRDLPRGPERDRYREAVGRSVALFNAHPYLAGLAVGAVARAEREGVAPSEIQRFRVALRGPLGSVGDRLIWTGTLPVASGVGLLAGVSGPAWLGPLVLLLLHNAAHLWLRFWGLAAGWHHGRHLARALRAPVLLAALRFVSPAALLVLGLALPVTGAWLVAALDIAAQSIVVGAFAVTLIVGRWLVPSLRGPLLGLLVAAAVVAGGWW